MKAVFMTILSLLRPRAAATTSSERRRPLGLGPDGLEDRAAPSAAGRGVPVRDLPDPADVGLPPLTSVAAAAEIRPPPELVQALGDQLALSMLAPLPGFLKPAGTATAETPRTGVLTATSFEIDNDALTDMAGHLRLPDGTPVSFSSPADGADSTPAPAVLHLVIGPLRLERLGVRLELSRMQVTARLAHSPYSPFSAAQEAELARLIAARIAGVFAAAFDIATRVFGAAAGQIHLPPRVQAALE